MSTIKEIRQAVIANRGGFENAADSEIMTIWRALDKDTQVQYLQSIKPAGKTSEKGKE